MATIEVTDLPDRVDVTVLAGRPFSLTLPVFDVDGQVDAASLVSARAQVRTGVGASDLLHTFSTENDPADAEISGDASGVITLTATSAVTSAWQEAWPGEAPESIAWWDLEVVDSDGETHQVTSPGMITLRWQVTR